MDVVRCCRVTVWCQVGPQSYNMRVGGLFTATSMRGVGAGGHHMGSWWEQSLLSQEKYEVSSYLKMYFLFRLMPILMCVSIHRMVLHVLDCGFLFETVPLCSTSIL